MHKLFYSKKKRRNKLILIFLILISIYLLFHFNIFKNFNFQSEDFLFFPILKKQNENSNKTYYFNVNYNNKKLEKINLVDTIEKNNKNNIKIAPGLEGKFDIQIKTNKSTEVKIQIIKDKNKFNNINFYIEDENLEKGVKIRVEKEKRVTVRWKWEYETNEKENKEDTENGAKIRDYLFYLKLIGKEDEK